MKTSFLKELSSRERALLVVFSLAIVGMLYFIVVDRPLRARMLAADEACATLQTQINTLKMQEKEIEDMQEDLGSLDQDVASISEIPSYNASKQEVDFLNNTLSQAQDYYIGFNQVTREGDLIRRDFSLQYRAADYKSAVAIVRRLEKSRIRCRIGDLAMSSAEDVGNMKSGAVSVNCSATFYETMYGGKEDQELPSDTSNVQNRIEDDLDGLMP
ncbi:MAG: type II secretion system protein M [Lachnospiraceae bacterium]|nr:type II secretion system protein M [Lachnospiraceae bacterium]